jgi:ABC-2 type transport system permease protein
VGSLLFGGAFIAVGVFISSLTESLVIAAMGTFFVSAVFLLINLFIPSSNTNAFFELVGNQISFNTRYTPFTEGILDFSSIVYFLSIIATFIFLTVRAIERRRWS